MQKSETTSQSSAFRGTILDFHCGLLPYLLLIMCTCVLGNGFSILVILQKPNLQFSSFPALHSKAK